MAFVSVRNAIKVLPGFEAVEARAFLRGHRIRCSSNVWIEAGEHSESLIAGGSDGLRSRGETTKFGGLELKFERSCSARCTGSGNTNGPATAMEWDVVEYPTAGNAGAGEGEDPEDGDSRRKGVGIIVSITEGSHDKLCHIEPLRQKDPSSNEWTEDEDQDEITVAVGQVRVLEAWYTQRMVADRISNPHGEHAENLWVIE